MAFMEGWVAYEGCQGFIRATILDKPYSGNDPEQTMTEPTDSLAERSEPPARVGAAQCSRFDVLGDALDVARVRGAVQYVARFTEPWGFDVSERQGRASFYLVGSGRGRIDALGEDGAVTASTDLGPGDLAVAWGRHRIVDAIGSPTVRADGRDRSGAGPTRPLVYGGGGPETTLTMGCFTYDPVGGRPLVAALPPLVHVPASGERVDERLGATIRLLALELEGAGPGSTEAVRRAAGVLFVQVVRAALRGACRSGVQGPSEWLAALADPLLGPALAAVHEAPERAWTVERMAEVAGMSRTAFAVRFREAVGSGPATYVRRLRMHRAALLLRTTTATAAEIGYRVGYESEVAFSRAFKREVRVTPGQYRVRSRVLRSA